MSLRRMLVTLLKCVIVSNALIASAVGLWGPPRRSTGQTTARAEYRLTLVRTRAYHMQGRNPKTAKGITDLAWFEPGSLVQLA